MVIYLRVSTEEQAKKGYSLPEQREACLAKAHQIAREQSEAPQIHELVDDFGGDIAERPVLEQVREFVRTHRPAWFICMDPDRFSRSLKLQLIVADDIEAHGTRLAFVQQEYNPDDLMSRAFFQFRGLMSELEKAKILERTSRGKRGKLKAGRRPNGAAPFGYRHRVETDTLEVYEPEAQWVRRLFDWVAHDHLSASAAARRLEALGVPCRRHGGRWHRSVVAGMLRNTTYYGEMRCNRKDFRGLGAVRRLPRERRGPLSARLRPADQWVTVPVPAIVPRDLWDQAQASLDAAARRGGRRDTGLLSMLLRCGECGAAMSYAGRYIRCQGRYTVRRQCGNRHHRRETVEGQVWARLVEWLTDPALLELDAADRGQPVACRLAAEEEALRERLSAEQRLQAAVLRRLALGQVDPGVADLLMAESQRHLRQIESDLAALGARLATQNAPAPSPWREAKASEAVRARLGTLGPAQRRHLVLLLVQRVSIDARGDVAVHLRDV